MIRLIEKIVFSGADGRVLIIPLAVLIYVLIGQAKGFIEEVKRICREVK